MDVPGQALLRALFGGLRRRPFGSAVSIVMLALGLGASTAIFSMLVPVLGSPSGIPGAERLVTLNRRCEMHDEGMTASFDQGLRPEEVRRLQEAPGAPLQVAESRRHRLVARTDSGAPGVYRGAFVSASYFPVMGVHPVLGRGLEAREDRPCEPTVVISHGLAQSLWGSGRQALGKSLHTHGRSCTVVGVMPRGFRGHDLTKAADLWLPLGAEAELVKAREYAEWGSTPPTLARLKPGVTPAQAEAYVRALATDPPTAPVQPGPVTLQALGGDRAEALESRLPAPWLMLGVAASLLVLACANVANLQLADQESRRGAFAVRLALGAPRWRLVGEVLMEHLGLSLVAGALGLALALPMVRGLESIQTVRVFDTPIPTGLSPLAVAFALGLVLLTALMVGLLPALRASRIPPEQSLKEGAARMSGRDRLKGTLVMAQVALSLTLVTAGALVGRSLQKARSQDFGYRPVGVAGVRVAFPDTWPKAWRAHAVKTLRDRVAGLPGVQAATWAKDFPLENEGQHLSFLPGMARPVRTQAVGPAYAATLGIDLKEGREFQILENTQGLAMFNEALARQVWEGQEAAGRPLGRYSVIGVMADHAQTESEGRHKPILYVPMAAGAEAEGCCILFRTQGDPEVAFPVLRELTRSIHPDLALVRMTTLQAQMDRLFHPLRVAAWLLGICGTASLVLAAMGIQSLLAFRVARQGRELGLRMALGADTRAIVTHVILHGLGGVVLGLGLGTLTSLAAGRLLQSRVEGLQAMDVPSLASAMGILVLAAVVATLLPALCAARVNPAVALRSE